LSILHLLAHLFGGCLAGYGAWLSFRGGVPWSFAEGFQATLLSSGVFSAAFLGIIAALTSLGNEFRPGKAVRLASSAAAVGLAVPMLGVAVFALGLSVSGLALRLPELVIRAGWWLCFSATLAIARGILIGNTFAGVGAFLGLAPSLLLSGLLLDRFFLPREMWLVGTVVMGISAGAGQGIALELLKQAWLEAGHGHPLNPQLILETEEVTVGSADTCDLSLPDCPDAYFTIFEKDGLHILESVEDDPVPFVGKGQLRYRALVDGDAVKIGDQVWVYHNRLVRTRDAVAQAAA
jgi:hypothetical protein